MDLNLQNKVVVITGGTSGIGAELALAFAKEGCRVSVCGRNEEKIRNLERRFFEEGYQLHTQVVDVRDIRALKQYIEGVGERFGALDIFVNNAGITIRKPFDTFSEEEFENLVNTNFKAAYFGSAYASAQMKKNVKGGVILNTSSFASIIPTAGIALYSAMKAALDKFTATLAAELAADNIRVISVQPGMTETPMTKENCEKNYENFTRLVALKRIAVPEDIVGAYLFLASEKASFITGVTLPVAGGKLTVQNPQWSYGSKESNW